MLQKQRKGNHQKFAVLGLTVFGVRLRLKHQQWYAWFKTGLHMTGMAHMYWKYARHIYIRVHKLHYPFVPIHCKKKCRFFFSQIQTKGVTKIFTIWWILMLLKRNDNSNLDKRASLGVCVCVCVPSLGAHQRWNRPLLSSTFPGVFLLSRLLIFRCSWTHLFLLSPVSLRQTKKKQWRKASGRGFCLSPVHSAHFWAGVTK